MKRTRFQITLLTLASAAALVAGTIAPAQARPTADQANVLVLPLTSSTLWVFSNDPGQGTDASVAGLIYAGLVKLNDHYQVVPDLAAALPKVSRDRLTYTFTLRPNLRFADGTPLTAKDVVASISRALSPAEHSVFAMTYLGHIKGAAAWNAGRARTLAGISAPNPQTVVFTLDSPISYFLPALTFPTSDVLKAGTTPGDNMDGPGDQTKNIASGPFMLGKPWRYRQAIYLVPNPRWYQAGTIRLKEIDLLATTDQASSYQAYLAGEVMESGVPSSAMASARNRPDFHSAPLLYSEYIVPNLGPSGQCKPLSCQPLNDVHFRRALLYATNRPLLVKLWQGQRQDLCGIIPQGIAGYDPSLCSLATYDPARARAELALARKDFGGTLPNAGKVSLTYIAGLQGKDIEYITLRNMWAAVGIDLTINAVPSSSFYPGPGGKDTYALSDGFWTCDYVDPQDFAENILASYTPFDFGSYYNPTVDRLLRQGDTMPNGPDRTRLYQRVQRLALQDVAFIPLDQVIGSNVWSTRIHGFGTTAASLGWPGYNDWTNVTVDP
jgi:ABC-type transport system substrate-binding protein